MREAALDTSPVPRRRRTDVATRRYNDLVRAVGIRELKNKLSEYLRLVRAGEEVLVTDRGDVVAEIRPPGSSGSESLSPGLRELVRRGVVRVGAPNDPALYKRRGPRARDGSALRLLDADRGER